jgi:hypothetical protein
MASTPEATRVTPEMEARFRAIADAEPPLEGIHFYFAFEFYQLMPAR